MEYTETKRLLLFLTVGTEIMQCFNIKVQVAKNASYIKENGMQKFHELCWLECFPTVFFLLLLLEHAPSSDGT